MSISSKIEQIRRQPENIRLRWVWGLTATFMALILLIWLLNIKSQPLNTPGNLLPENEVFSSQFNQEKKSITEAMEKLKETTATRPSADTPSEASE